MYRKKQMLKFIQIQGSLGHDYGPSDVTSRGARRFQSPIPSQIQHHATLRSFPKSLICQ